MGKRPLVRLAAAAAGGLLALMVTAPAWAGILPLNQKLPILAAEFDKKECADEDDRMAGKAVDEDGWHFVAAGGSFVEISLTFEKDPDNPGPATRVSFTGTPSSPNEFTFFDAGINANHHAYIFTPAGWQLVEAQADI